MAIVIEWDDKDKAEWEEWVSSRPESIHSMCREFPPNKLYKLKSTGHRVTISSYSEDGTCTVVVSGRFNMVSMERQVFGIKPEDLVECGLPGRNDALGVLYKEEGEITEHIARVKEGDESLL